MGKFLRRIRSERAGRSGRPQCRVGGTKADYGTTLPLDLTCDDRRALLFRYCPETLGESDCTDAIVAGAMDCATSG